MHVYAVTAKHCCPDDEHREQQPKREAVLDAAEKKRLLMAQCADMKIKVGGIEVTEDDYVALQTTPLREEGSISSNKP